MKRMMMFVVMGITVVSRGAAENDKPIWERLTAARELDDQTALTAIVRSNEDIKYRQLAMDKLNDQVVLADIAKNAKEEWVRDAAVRKLNAQEHKDFLEETAKNDEGLRVRLSAMFALGDPVVPAEFEFHVPRTVMMLPAYWRRKEVVEDIPQNQAQLAETAKNGKDKGVRITAVKRLTDQAVLADVAKNDKDWLVRLFAMEKLDSQAVLAELAKKDNDILIRKEAEKRLTLFIEAEKERQRIEQLRRDGVPSYEELRLRHLQEQNKGKE